MINKIILFRPHKVIYDGNYALFTFIKTSKGASKKIFSLATIVLGKCDYNTII